MTETLPDRITEISVPSESCKAWRNKGSHEGTLEFSQKLFNQYQCEGDDFLINNATWDKAWYHYFRKQKAIHRISSPRISKHKELQKINSSHFQSLLEIPNTKNYHCEVKSYCSTCLLKREELGWKNCMNKLKLCRQSVHGIPNG